MDAASIALTAAEYWELRTRIRDVEAIELDALKAAQPFKAKAAQAAGLRQALFERLAVTYGFDPTRTYRFNDGMCALVLDEPPTGQTP